MKLWQVLVAMLHNHRWILEVQRQDLYSLSRRTSYRKISRNLEAVTFGFKLFQSLWNLTDISAALLPRCLSNFRAIRSMQLPISRLRDSVRFGGKTSNRLVNRGPGVMKWWDWSRNNTGLNMVVMLAKMNTNGSPDWLCYRLCVREIHGNTFVLYWRREKVERHDFH